MKIIVVDISYNSSAHVVKDFLRANMNATQVYCFDYLSYKYSSADALLRELDEYPSEFFDKPSAFYDCITAVLSKERKRRPHSILICSPQEDDCSRLSDNERFNNYIYHFRKNNSIDLEFNNSSSFTGDGRKPSLQSFFQKLISVFVPDDNYEEKEYS